MGKALGKSVVTVTVAFEIDEEEARSLYALARLSLGTIVSTYPQSLRDHAVGLGRFLETVRDTIPAALATADKARSLIHGEGG